MEECSEQILTVHVNVICWHGHCANASKIAREVVPVADQVTIVYSHRRPGTLSNVIQFFETSEDWFFGRKFEVALQMNRCDVMLQIQADAVSESWSDLVLACQRDFLRYKKLGVWGPNVWWTPYPLELVKVGQVIDGGLTPVLQTDGIVWALRRQVLDRLSEFDYSHNNLGWGIDWCAICFAYANALTVARNVSVGVDHPKARGYSSKEAQNEMDLFLDQQTSEEKVLKSLFDEIIRSRRQRGSLWGREFEHDWRSLEIIRVLKERAIDRLVRR